MRAVMSVWSALIEEIAFERYDNLQVCDQNMNQWIQTSMNIKWFQQILRFKFGKGSNMVLESTVSNTELSEFFGPHRILGKELSEFLSAYYWCAKANSPSFPKTSPSLTPNSVSSLW